MKIDQYTQLNAVVGYPIGHSLSPVLHNFIYEQMRINAVMLAFSQENIAEFIKAMRSLPIQLCAVTIPHKQKIMPYLDSIDPDAQALGSVNTIISHQEKLYGYNTDIIGVEETFKNIDLANKKVLLLGAGAVAEMICFYLKKRSLVENGGQLFCHNRNQQKAIQLMNKFSGIVCDEKILQNQKMDIIINTTPVGMYPQIDATPLDAQFLHASQIVFDVIYNPVQTRLLKDADGKGALVISGLDMFIAQAQIQIKLWLKLKILSEKPSFFSQDLNLMPDKTTLKKLIIENIRNNENPKMSEESST